MGEFQINQSNRQRQGNKIQNVGKISGEITLNQKYNFKLQTMGQLATIIWKRIRRVFYSQYISKDVELLVYKICIRSILTNACPIWYNTSPHIIEKFRASERKILKAATWTFKESNTKQDQFECSRNITVYNTANCSRIDRYLC